MMLALAMVSTCTCQAGSYFKSMLFVYVRMYVCMCVYVCVYVFMYMLYNNMYVRTYNICMYACTSILSSLTIKPK